MGNSEEGKSSKSDKSSSPAPADQTNIHVYPDWAAMQAYYSPRVPIPPYYNSAMPSGHPPHPYMWGPQPMMPPYGAPYAAIYSHGGVYAHPAVSLGSHSQGHGVPLSPATATPLSIETPTKSSGITDRSLMKKLKGFDGLAMSIGNGNTDSAEGAGEHGLSKSIDTEGSSDGSDGSTSGVDQTKRKRRHEGTPTAGGKNQGQSGSVPAGDPAYNKVLGTAGGPANIIGNASGTAETEELARKVECLTAENVGLKSEIGQLTDKSDKLRRENVALMEKLKNAQLVRTEEMGLNNVDDKRAAPVNTENLLSRVNNSGSHDRSTEQEGEVYEKKSNSGAKLHQLLGASPRADAVAAG
ncbi:G-box-binding factor 3-like [Carica papaya]|uniref:G-box-binding factor 3-like n=1 Tax=Carica papaya TaxID=3649 RepID=UPI000B8C71A4|nr:G-box-binding factor 3-like [Carica papaya]